MQRIDIACLVGQQLRVLQFGNLTNIISRQQFHHRRIVTTDRPFDLVLLHCQRVAGFVDSCVSTSGT